MCCFRKTRQPTARTLLNDLGLFPHLKMEKTRRNEKNGKKPPAYGPYTFERFGTLPTPKKMEKTPKTRQVTNAKTPQNPPGKPSKKPQK